jgi:Rps23 Pro-64 3,4-dihydroxylase Tpa1-like proline 4-hydroxylase
MEGGYLEYYEKYSPSRTLEDGSIVWPEEKPELIKPKWNRLIIFEAANLHAVTEIVSGRRRAIAINLWGHKPTEFSKEY